MNLLRFVEINNKITNSKMKGYTVKVAVFLLGYDLESLLKNHIMVSQTVIANSLGMNRTLVAKAIRELKENEIIMTEKCGKLNIYRFI